MLGAYFLILLVGALVGAAARRFERKPPFPVVFDRRIPWRNPFRPVVRR